MQRVATAPPSILGPTTSALVLVPGRCGRRALDFSLRSVPGRGGTGVAMPGLTSCPQVLMMSARELLFLPWYMSGPGGQACLPFGHHSIHQGEEESDIVAHFLSLGMIEKDMHQKNSDFMLFLAHILEEPGFS